MEIIRQTGNVKLLSLHKTAFFCSRRMPDGAYPVIRSWVQTLSAENDCIICGNHSPMEQVVCAWLLQQKIPTILVLAETFPSKWPPVLETALREERLLVATRCDESVHRISRQSAFDRNELMLSIADEVVVGYCAEGGNIEKQVCSLPNVRYLLTNKR